MIYDSRPCALGEGPLWHPLRAQLFWFDILGKRLLSRLGDVPVEWQFDQHVSAAGWIDAQNLLLATETGLEQFDIETGKRQPLIPLEADNPVTRSNDGRADAHGGFWIGTMGKNAEPEAGAIYRYYRGELRELFPKITIPNAICFTPDGLTAYFTDTVKRIIWRQALDEKTGWPVGAPEPHIDLRKTGLNPDGAVVDADGCLWNAQWGAGRVARYGRDGQFQQALDIPATQASCPAFGSKDLTRLFVTSASVGLGASAADADMAGKTYALQTDIKGQAEHQIICG